ncbi:MAG: hypothetical protein ACREER_06330 [Alphaproteobacteria bacterium]
MRIDASRIGAGPEMRTLDDDLGAAGLAHALPALVFRVIAELLTCLIAADAEATESRP